MKKKFKAGLVVFGLIILALIMVSIALPNFIRIKDKAKSAEQAYMRSTGMYAGGDAAAPMAEMDFEEYGDVSNITNNSDYDAQYRDQTRSGRGSYESSGVDPQSGNLVSSIGNWLNPVAWAQEDNVDERYIIRSGNIEMEIDDYDQASAEVRTIAGRHGGIITESQMQKYGDNMRVGWVTLRVPSDKFQLCYEDLQEIGEVKVQSVNSEDVSNEYIAGVSRMEALTMEHQTLQGMLADAREVQRTRGLGEAYSVLLDTQARLSQVTTELQTVENRVKGLRDRISRSTISVNLSERPLAPPPDEFSWGFGNTFENAKKDLMSGISYTINGVIYFMVNGLLWWLIWIGIILLAWKLFLRRIWRAVLNLFQDDKAEAADSK